MVSRNTTLVPSLGLRIGPACEAGLSAGMRRERVSPQIRKKKERKKDDNNDAAETTFNACTDIIGLLSEQTYGLRYYYYEDTES